MQEQATQSNPWTTWIPVLCAVIAAAVSIWGGAYSRHAQDKTRKEERSIERLNRAIDVYGSIAALRSTSNALRESLNREGQTPFRLIQTIRHFKLGGTPLEQETIAEILRINEKIAQLMEGNASLLEHPLPKTFEQFLVHQRVLKTLWDLGEDAPSPAFPPFPNDIDVDIEKRLAELRRSLSGLDQPSLFSGGPTGRS